MHGVWSQCEGSEDQELWLRERKLEHDIGELQREAQKNRLLALEAEWERLDTLVLDLQEQAAALEGSAPSPRHPRVHGAKQEALQLELQEAALESLAKQQVEASVTQANGAFEAQARLAELHEVLAAQTDARSELESEVMVLQSRKMLEERRGPGMGGLLFRRRIGG